MIRNLEIKKQGEGYLILDQAGSNYHADEPVHASADRADAEAWLTGQGAVQAEVSRALDEAGSAERVFVAIADDYSEANDFPKKSS